MEFFNMNSICILHNATMILCLLQTYLELFLNMWMPYAFLKESGFPQICCTECFFQSILHFG